MRVAPLATVPKLQVTFWPATVHDALSAPPTARPVTAAGTVSAVCTPAASDGPLFVTVIVQVTAWPGTAGFGVACDFTIATSALGSTGVGPAVLVQCAAAGQVGSPPPETVAVLATLGAAAAVGVTGITKLVLAEAARPLGIVQVTVWPAAVQPAGSVPMVSEAGIVSVMVAAAVVAAVPVFVTCSV